MTPRRQAIHGGAAAVLAGQQGTRPVDLANHLLGAGRFAEAVPVCLASADEAERASAFREAIGLLERALPHLTDPGERARLICRIGKDHWQNGESAAGARLLTEGTATLDELGESIEAARSRIVLGRCLWEGEQPEGARVEYVRARDVLEAQGPSADLAMAHMRLAGLDAFELDYAGCLEHSRRAVEIAEGAGADYERVWALGFLSLGLIDSGEHVHGFEVMDDCYEEAAAKGYWVIANNMTFNDVWSRTHLLMGGLEGRLNRFGEMPDMGPAQAGKEILASYVLLVRGDLAGARESAERALELYIELGYGKMVWRSRVQLATALVELRRHEEAARALPPTSSRTTAGHRLRRGRPDQGSSRGRPGSGGGGDRPRDPRAGCSGLATYRETLALGAETLISGGQTDAAESLLDVAAAHTTDAGQSYIDEMRGRVMLARGDAAGAEPPLAAAVEEAEERGYLALALRRRVAHAEALAGAGSRAEAEAELRGVAEEADRIGAALIRAEAATVAGRQAISLPAAPALFPEGEGEAPDAVPVGERLVTSLFADVRGYTELTCRGLARGTGGTNGRALPLREGGCRPQPRDRGQVRR